MNNKRTKQIALQFREVYLDGKWVANTNLKQELSALNWKQAIQKVGSLNTIALLTFHLNYYVSGVLKVLRGGSLDIRDKFSFDMPTIKSEEDWQAILSELVANAEEFAQQIENMTDEKLETPFVDEKYGNYSRNLHGMIEHSYYHLGQIVLIKKLIKEDDKT